MIDCVLISPDEEFRRLAHDLIVQSEARMVLDIPKAAQNLSRETLARVLAADPQVVFIDLDGSLTGVRVIEVLGQEAPEIGLIVAGPHISAEALLSVMRAGAHEYLPRPLSQKDAQGAWIRVRRRLAPASKEPDAPPGRLTTVFSAKGGTGVTMVAANLAIALRLLTDETTLFLDLVPSMGTGALYLGLQPRYSYLDVVQNFHRIDEELFRSFLEVHDGGLAVLASPPVTEDPGGPTADQAMGLLRLCRRHFAHVVVDGGSSLTASLAATLRESDERIIVSTPELPALRNLRRAGEILGQSSMNGSEPPRVVLNQFREDAGGAVKDVETSLRHEVDTVLVHDDPGVVQSINLAEPLVLQRKSRVGRGLMGLASSLTGPEHEVDERSGLLGTLFRPFRNQPPAAKETA